MAPADPLFLMWCAANRVTPAGRVAGPDQKVGVEEALRGVTIDAAYSLKLEDEIGSIEPGKRANLTILDDSPLAVEPMKIRDIAVWGTVMEGRVFPVAEPERKASLMPPTDGAGVKDADYSRAAFEHALKAVHSHL